MYINLGKKIQYYREAKSMTQEQLAEIVDVSQNFISSIERGKKTPSFDTFLDIVDALDVTANDLLEDTIKNGYKAKASRLSNFLEALSPESRGQILAVVETMIENSKNN